MLALQPPRFAEHLPPLGGGTHRHLEPVQVQPTAFPARLVVVAFAGARALGRASGRTGCGGSGVVLGQLGGRLHHPQPLSAAVEQRLEVGSDPEVGHLAGERLELLRLEVVELQDPVGFDAGRVPRLVGIAGDRLGEEEHPVGGRGNLEIARLGHRERDDPLLDAVEVDLDSDRVTGRGGGRNGEGTSDRSATAYGRPPRGNPISNWSASATGLRSRSPRRYRYLPCGSQVGLESRSTGRVTYADRPLSTFTALTAEVFTGPQRVYAIHRPSGDQATPSIWPYRLWSRRRTAGSSSVTSSSSLRWLATATRSASGDTASPTTRPTSRSSTRGGALPPAVSTTRRSVGPSSLAAATSLAGPADPADPAGGSASRPGSQVSNR